jgi:hypothetical protein
MTKRLELSCPCCDTKLVVDGETGDILSEERPKTSDRVSFDAALREQQQSASKRASAFDQAYDRTQRSQDVLAKKFEEARRKAAKDPSKKPPNPFDLD